MIEINGEIFSHKIVCEHFLFDVRKTIKLFVTDNLNSFLMMLSEDDNIIEN